MLTRNRMRVRAGLVSVIYQKALVLSNDGRTLSSGDIFNLMSVDAMRLQDFCTYALIAISGPFQIVLAFISLYDLLGFSAFVGVAIMVFSVPLNTCTSPSSPPRLVYVRSATRPRFHRPVARIKVPVLPRPRFRHCPPIPIIINSFAHQR